MAAAAGARGRVEDIRSDHGALPQRLAPEAPSRWPGCAKQLANRGPERGRSRPSGSSRALGNPRARDMPPHSRPTWQSTYPEYGNLCERSVPICEVPEMAMGRVHAESHAALAPARSGAPPSRPRSRFASRQRVSLDTEGRPARNRAYVCPAKKSYQRVDSYRDLDKNFFLGIKWQRPQCFNIVWCTGKVV